VGVSVALENESLRRAHDDLLQRLAATIEANKRLERENAALRAERQALLRRIFGRSSEKLDTVQHELFQEAASELEQAARDELAETAAAQGGREQQARAARRRRLAAGDLPRERRIHELAEHERLCTGCNETMQPMGEQTSERLDYQPAVLRVVEDVCIKYSCPRCHDGVATAEAPERPIPRVLADAPLLAHLATSKFGYHQPLYRIEQMLELQGASLSRKTMCCWLGATSELLTPVVEQMKRELLAEPLIQSDDTTLRFRSRSAPQGMGRGYLWAYSKPWAEVVFSFRTDRSRAGPVEFLAGYKGAVQADGYAGYNELFRRNGNLHVGCMAHVRRKIFDARMEDPGRAELLVAGIQSLYRMERRAREQGITGARLLELRAGEPLRVLGVLEAAMTEFRATVLPKSGLGRALAYALDQWPSIVNYTKVAEAELDNNGVENAIRPVALGRRNWMFAGSESGGRRAAVLFSLVTTCKRLGINPFEYLSDVIARIGNHKASRIAELTPRAWKAARA
jgi:transposase